MNKKDFYPCLAIFFSSIVLIYLPWQIVQTVGVLLLILAIAAVQFRNLKLGFILTLFFIPFSLRLNLSNTNDALSFDAIFLTFDTLAVFTLRHFWQERKNPLQGWSRLIWATVGLFTFAMLLSLVFSADKGITVRKMWNISQYLVAFAVMLALWREYGVPLLKRSLWITMLSGGLLSLYSLILFYLQYPIGDAWAMRLWLIQNTTKILHGIRTYEVFMNGDNNWILINGPLRAVGTFPTPMGLGQFLFSAS